MANIPHIALTLIINKIHKLHALMPINKKLLPINKKPHKNPVN